MVAGVIARDLGVEMYRVDVSRITSKWIGETEKNLGSLFDAAEDGQVMLLFDEADSLFAKRTEVKSSVDRYANMEVNYLLQRLDSFEGIAILTTNFGTSIDPAFKRRLSFRVTFPFPDEEMREQLWKALIPPQAPDRGADRLRAAVAEVPAVGRLHPQRGAARRVPRRRGGLGADPRSHRARDPHGVPRDRKARRLGRPRMSAELRTIKRVVLLCALAACGLPDGEYFGDVPSLKGRDLTHLRWCNSGEPEYVDPAMASTTTAVKLVYALFDGLYAYDANGLPEPSLATGMEQSDDLRRFTFRMRSDGRWTNGRPITAYDFQYHLARVAHPLTASPNADGMFAIKNVQGFLGGRIRVVVADEAGLAAGTIVELLGADGQPLAGDATPPGSNERRSSRVLALRDLGAAEAAAYARVPRGSPVELVEISGRPGAAPSPGAEPWGYVFWNSGDGVYGWVPLTELDVVPGAGAKFKVRPVAKRYVPGLDATSEELAADDAVDRAAVEVAGEHLLLLPEVLGVRATDPYTLVVETDSPTPYMLQLAPQRGARATPREAVSRWPRRWAEPGRFVGSGGMKLERWLERDHIEMVKSDTFWNAASIKLTRITAFSIADQAAITNYYYTGGCDATTSNPVPATYMPVMTGEKRAGKPFKDFYVQPWLATYYPIVQTKRFPNRHFRRALSYAIDRRSVVHILKAGQVPSAQLSPGQPIKDLSEADLALCGVTRDQPGVAMIMVSGELCYVPPPGLDFDVAKAKEELALARAENGVPAGFTYRYNAGSEAHKLIGEYLQQQWKQVLGLDVTLESQEWKTMVAVSRQGEFDVMRFGATSNFPDAESEVLPNFRCASTDNRPQWCNPEFEAALDAAKKLTDRKARLAKIYEAEQILVEDAAILPLYVYTQQFLIRPYVKGLPRNLTDQMQIERAWIDPDWDEQ